MNWKPDGIFLDVFSRYTGVAAPNVPTVSFNVSASLSGGDMKQGRGGFAA